MIAPGVGASVLPALRGTADSLSAAGVTTAVNVHEARPGGAWIKPLRIRPGTFTSSELVVALYVLVPDHGTEPALTAVGELVDLALTVVGDRLDLDVPIALDVALATPDNPAGYPAALLTLTLDLY